MSGNLLQAIEEIRSNSNRASYDEARTKQGVILPLLSAIGWNLFGPDEVRTEYSTFNKRVDYALRIDLKNKVFIEAKRIGTPLEPCEEQLLGYSFQEGIKLAVLTNGITWHLYLPMHEGTWKERKFYTLDIEQQEPSDFVGRLVEFLSRANVESGQSVQSAEQIMHSSKRQIALSTALPAAWNEIVEKPNETLVDLINEVVEKRCGFAAEEELILEFLVKHRSRFIVVGLAERPFVKFGGPQSSSVVPPTELQHAGTRADFHMDCIRRVEARLSRSLPIRSGNMWYSSDRNIAACCACSNVKPRSSQYWFTIQRSQIEKLTSAQDAYLALGCGSVQNTILIYRDIVDDILPRLPRATASQQDGWHFKVDHEGGNWLLRSVGKDSQIDITAYVL